MAVLVEFNDGSYQWFPGGNRSLPVSQQNVPEGGKPVSMCPDVQVYEWRRFSLWNYGFEIVSDQ